MARMIDKKTTSDNVLVVLTYLTLGADLSTFERVGVGRPLEKLLQQPFRLKKICIVYQRRKIPCTDQIFQPAPSP